MTFHQRLDVERWTQLLHPMPTPPRRWQFWRSEDDSPEIVHGPLEIAYVERWRRTHPPTGKTTPADWFVWSTKQAKHPFLTRLGGVPHREADLPWPRDRQGQPSVFLGQICFLDSLDIVDGSTPGDVLLVFGGSNPNEYHVEWSAKELSTPLERANTPKTSTRIPQLTGVIHRTVEDWSAPRQGTKIGATTLFIQGFDDHSILCALSFFCPRQRWATLENESLDKRARRSLGEFRLGDAGCIYMDRSRDGAVDVWSDCY